MYLKSILEDILVEEVVIVGKPEFQLACPCCQYRTLDGRLYSICRICLWEDDGTKLDNLEKISSVNGATLEEYRKRYNENPNSNEIMFYKQEDTSLTPA
jgi:hypothetical protein